MFGPMMRVCKEFQNPLTLKSLDFSEVHSNLEFRVVVWCPNYTAHSIKIESFQKSLCHTCFMKFGWFRYFQYGPYNFKCILLEIKSLGHRRRDACACFIFDLLTGRSNSSPLLSRINLNVPSKLCLVENTTSPNKIRYK